ncbi:hypothetical protein EHM69_00680 [candidate division KSB1 bacterium]|nr:MAG: hypothetical protein EHM69_13175 [candidate division KSB1 bacterium]RPH96697.1 MAG: hypothetical protein EHM69_00680 [candidate division KSB1 bacterium]
MKEDKTRNEKLEMRKKTTQACILALAISLLIICAARAQEQEEPAMKFKTATRECREASAELHMRILDSLISAIHEICPPELVDEAKLQTGAARLRADAKTEIDSAQSHFRYNLPTVLAECGGAYFLHYTPACHDGSELFYELLPSQVKWRRDENDNAHITVEYSLWGEIAMRLDGVLDSVRGAEGMLLDLRHMQSLFENDVTAILGRFSDEKVTAYTARQRVRGTDQYITKSIEAEPRGKYQYVNPLVVLVDSSRTQFFHLLIQALKKRPYTKIVGTPILPPKGVLYKQVTLPGGSTLMVASAIPLDADGNKLKPLEPHVLVPGPYGDNDLILEAGKNALKDLVKSFRVERQDRMERMFQK